MKDEELVRNLNEIIQDVRTIAFEDHPKIDLVHKRLEMLIRRRFGIDSHYLVDISNNDYSDYSLIFGGTEGDYRKAWEAGKTRLVNTIETMIEEIKSFPLDIKDTKSKSESDKSLQNIFIVHGHDNEMVDSVARFIKRLELIPIVLREQPNQSRTIIEKFELYSDTDFAIVLFSPDDLGRAKNDAKLKPRPRQNVVFELGFFVGKLTRKNVVVLHREVDNFEMLSDFIGVLFVPYREGWELKVAKEIKVAGFQVDLNRLAK